MIVNLITNWADGKGLWRDGCIVERLLTAWGHTPVRVQYTERLGTQPADLNLFLETVRSDLFPLAPVNWWMPNPEWCRPEDLKWLPNCDRVVCKTHEAYSLFTPLTDKAVYVGFESEDRYDPSVPREPRVLHVAGGSILKGTQAVLAAWEQHHIPYPLTVIGDEQVVKPRAIPNVTYRLNRLPDDELRRLQNSHTIHLQPSETEGWGHTIHEGLSVNASVVTTRPLTIPGVSVDIPMRAHKTRGLAPLYAVQDVAYLGLAVTLADTNRPTEWEDGPCAPRFHFLKGREQFRQRLGALVEELP